MFPFLSAAATGGLSDLSAVLQYIGDLGGCLSLVDVRVSIYFYQLLRIEYVLIFKKKVIQINCLHVISLRKMFLFLSVAATDGLTDLSAVLQYIGDLGCVADIRVAMVISDFIITKNAAQVGDKLASLISQNYKVRPERVD